MWRCLRVRFAPTKTPYGLCLSNFVHVGETQVVCGYVKEADSSVAYLDIMFAAFTGEQPSRLSCSQIHDMFAQWIAAGDASGC